MSSKKNAIVVGAGLVGSLLTVLLAKRGYRVSLYERRPDVRKLGFRGGRSINLALSDRGWRALDKAGLADAIAPHAIPMKGRMMHDQSGELTFQPYGQEGQAIYSVSRGGLNLALLEMADKEDGVDLHFDHRCAHVDLEQRLVHFQHEESGALKEVHADLIFGADGAFSALRSSLMKRPRFNYSQTYLDYGYKELSIPPGEDGSHRLDPNALHIWPRGSYMLIALPNTDGSFTCTLFLPFEGEESFERLDNPKSVVDFFSAKFPDTLSLITELESDFSNNPTSTLVTVRCSPWHHEDWLLLLGDASHAIVPFYGQGMNSGFEDCSVLDDMMDEFGEDWSEIIPAFSKRRIPNANAIADLALRNFVEMRDKVADPDFLLRKEIAAWLQDRYPDFLPLYSQVTFSHIPYADALEEGKAQDRLFESILSLDGVRENWRENPRVLEVFEEWRSARRSLTAK